MSRRRADCEGFLRTCARESSGGQEGAQNRQSERVPAVPHAHTRTIVTTAEKAARGVGAVAVGAADGVRPALVDQDAGEAQA